MACHHVALPGGGHAIVCGPRLPSRRCSHCGEPTRAGRECDWKVPDRKSGTCDAYLCASCSTSPAPEKDLCRPHAEAWGAHLLRLTTTEDANHG